MVDVNLRNVHLKVIGQELDWFPHSANARPARCLEHLLQGGQVGARSCKTKRPVRTKFGNFLMILIRKDKGLLEQEQKSIGEASFLFPNPASTSSNIPRLIAFFVTPPFLLFKSLSVREISTLNTSSQCLISAYCVC